MEYFNFLNPGVLTC